MSYSWRRLLKDCVPPGLVRLVRRQRDQGSRYRGNYASWEAARAASDGYDADLILQQCRASLGLVRDGKADYERDSVLFHRPQYPFPLVTGLLRAASLRNGRLSVIDVGGSLGSSYYQCRTLLAGIAPLRWSIVEQPAFVACGQAEFASDELAFYESLEAAFDHESPSVVLLSSVLPYVPDPYALLAEVHGYRPAHVIIDRTPVLIDQPDRLTVQTVPEQIYGAVVRYPAWILNRDRLLDALPGYVRLADFDALDGRIDLGDGTAPTRGFLLDRTNPFPDGDRDTLAPGSQGD